MANKSLPHSNGASAIQALANYCHEKMQVMLQQLLIFQQNIMAQWLLYLGKKFQTHWIFM